MSIFLFRLSLHRAFSINCTNKLQTDLDILNANCIKRILRYDARPYIDENLATLNSYRKIQLETLPSMKKLLTSPSKMALPEIESGIYQNILKQATDISLNLMAVKVTNHPEDFLGWCFELLDVAKRRINFDLLEDTQLPTVKKLQDLLQNAISYLQLKSLRVAP